MIRVAYFFLAVLVGCSIPSATFAQIGKSAANSVGPAPTESRTWNSRNVGGLIEGPCLGVIGDQIKILHQNIERLVPIELFHPDDLKLIRAHFSLDEPFPEQATAEPVPLAECSAKHTLRGGIFPAAKIVGHEGNTVFLVDEKGLKYRVPFFMFAEGVQGSVRDTLTKLDGKPFVFKDDGKPRVAATKPKENRPANNSQTKPAKEKLAKNKAGENSSKAQPMPPKVALNNPPSPMPMPPAIPSIPANPPSTTPKPELKPIGDSRVWTMRGGKVRWEGKFLELTPQLVRIVNASGKTEQLPFALLEEADQQYAQALAKNGKVGKAPTGALVISSNDGRLIVSDDGKSTHLLDGKTLYTLGADGKVVGSKRTFGEDYSIVCERDAYWVAALGKELHLLDKKTLKLQKKHDLWKYKQIHDVALHPKRRVAVVSVEQVLDVTRKNPEENQRIVLVDEATGKVHETDEAFGSWLRLDPSGEFLLAGFHVAFKNGPDQEFDATGRLVPRLNYEHIDILNRFRIDGFKLKLDQQHENAGTNGQGVVLSPDGERVCYLSFTGYPTFSYNVVALRAKDFDEKPVTFAMKEKADCKCLVFSPDSKLAASKTTGGGVLFDASTGDDVSERLATDADLEDAVIHDLAFSTDGKHLIYIASRGGSERFLKVVAIQSP